MNIPRLHDITRFDLSQWYPSRISPQEALEQFGLSEIDNPKVKFLWKVVSESEIVVSANVLEWLGVNKTEFLRQMDEARLEMIDGGQRQNKMLSDDFYELLMMSTTSGGTEMRKLVVRIKEIYWKYTKYHGLLNNLS